MNTEFEPIILKKLTHDGEFFNKTMPILKQKYFSTLGNQELFGIIKEYFSKYRNYPSLTELVAMVKDVSNQEIRTEIITSLRKVNETEEVKNLDFMLETTVAWIKDALYMEALQVGSDGLMKKDDALKLKAQEILDERAKITIDSDLGLDFDDIEAMIAYYSERNVGIRTQHKSLNKRLGPGFLPGTLSVILAPSGVGKSLLMTDLISGIIKDSKNILLVSLEMADKEIMKRVHANALDLPINNLGDLSKTEGELKDTPEPILKDHIVNAFNRLKTSGECGKLFIKDYPSGSFSALMLEQLVESYRIEKGIEFDIVFVDYVGIMKSDLVSPSAGLYSYVKSIGEEVRASAKKLGLPIVSASQLNRSATNAEDADNSNVSDSMGTVMTADFMLFLLQNEEMKERGEIVCKCTKNRFTGLTDTWMMNVIYKYMRFQDMIVQNSADISEITATLGDNNGSTVVDDFGILTPQKQIDAEEFAKTEIKDIVNRDMGLLQEHEKDPFKSDVAALYDKLGI